MQNGVRRIHHASHWGAYTLLVESGRIVGTEPFALDPAPSPIIHSVKDWADTPDRIRQPMARKSWLEDRTRSRGEDRGREDFVPISWKEATALAASEIDRVRRQHGNASIFAGSYGWTSCGRFHHASSQLKRMLNLVGGYTGHVDTYSIAAGPAILRHVLGNEDACQGRGNTFDTIAANTETLLVFGAITPRTAQTEAGSIGQHLVEGFLSDLEAKGTRVVHVSPLKDDMPASVRATWVPIRPNTDTALMLALACEIVKAGRHDRKFLAECCSGSETFLDYLAGRSDGVEKNAAWASGITGIPVAAIGEIVAALCGRRSMITVSWSLQRAHHGEQPFWAGVALAATLGQIGLPGGGVGFGYGSLGGVGGPIVTSRPPALSQLTKPNPTFIPVARVTEMLENPGGRFTYQGKTHEYPDIRLVLWAGGNPYHHHQDINRLRKAWSRPETIVVVDPVWTATAERADLVLPASTSIERNDIAGNRRTEFVLAMHKAVEPVGEARSDFEIFSGIATELGVGAAFTEGRDEMQWIRHLYDEAREDARRIHQHVMPDFDTFWAEGYARLPAKSNFTYLADYRDDPAAHALKTESGRIVLGSRALAALDYSDCRPHPAWLPPREWLGMPEQRAPHMLHLISHQPEGKLHSQLDASAASQAAKRDGNTVLRLNPADADACGVTENMRVRIWNERGETLAVAHVSDTVARGVAVLPTGSKYAPIEGAHGALDVSGNPNVLSLDIGTSSWGQGCSAHTCMVSVEPYVEEVSRRAS